MLVQGPDREGASDQSGAIHACTALPALIEIHTEADTAPGKTCVFHAIDALRASIVRIAPHGERSPGPHSGEIGVLPPVWGARGARGGAVAHSPKPPCSGVDPTGQRFSSRLSPSASIITGLAGRRADRSTQLPRRRRLWQGRWRPGFARNRTPEIVPSPLFRRQVLPRVALAELNLRAD